MTHGTPREVDQEQLGGGDRLTVASEAGRDAAEALRALTKASRACLLYDAENDAVARFLGELDGTMRRALRHGPLRLEVRPFELLCGAEVVYRERDRERSFAFRLYRDGIRRLEIDPEVPWKELVRLVGVMSVRFTGVRQREDDAVTLLWSARLEHIRAETVHGYTHAEPAAGTPRAAGRARLAERVDAAAGAEPMPRLEREATPHHRPLTPSELRAVHREADGSQLADWCVRIARHLADAAGEPDDPIPAESCRPAVLDLARVLVEGGHDRLLAAAGDALATVPEVVAAFAEPEILDRVVRGVLDESLGPAALEPVLRHGPPSAVRSLLQRIDRSWRAVPEGLRAPLVATLVGARPSEVIAMAPRMLPELRSDLLAAVAHRDPEAATTLALDLVAQRGREIRLAALAVLERAPYSPEIGKAMVKLLGDTDDPTTRMRTAVVLARHRERRGWEVLVAAIERGVDGGAGSQELKTLAQAAAIVDPRAALELFRGWVRPTGLLGRLRATAGPRWWPALWGLSRIPGTEAEETLRWMCDHTDGEFRIACERALVARRPTADGGRR